MQLPTEEQTRRAIERGAVLFQYLAGRRNAYDECLGIGYADFIRFIYEVEDYWEVRRRKWCQTHVDWILAHAHAVTDLVGRIWVENETEEGIEAGMEAFVWNLQAERMPKTFTHDLPYKRDAWERVFPADRRLLLRPKDFAKVHYERR